jgi:predicted nucleotidyltransferase
VHQRESRRAFSEDKVRKLRDLLTDAEARAKDKACVYATGSFGRGEASSHSDLDLFIVGRDCHEESTETKKRRSELPNLDEICIKADLIRATKHLQISDFSGDGEYLIHYSVSELVNTLGTRQDDILNTFTERLLLLLESRPLVGDVVYSDVVKEVVLAYWRDYEDHKDDFLPAFLTNDILRLWRTFCVNYEAGTDREPPERKAKGKLKNYKLKHSRMLTCYSGILFLLNKYAVHRTVTPDDALEMTKLSPTERLENLQEEPSCIKAHATIARLLDRYDRFLLLTDASEHELLEKFSETSRSYFQEASEFGDSVADALAAIGTEQASRFYRLVIV